MSIGWHRIAVSCLVSVLVAGGVCGRLCPVMGAPRQLQEQSHAQPAAKNESASHPAAGNQPVVDKNYQSLLDSFDESVREGNNSKALATLDRLLALPMERADQHSAGAAPGRSATRSMIARAYAFAAHQISKNPKLSVEIYQKILSAQMKQLPSDDEQISMTLTELGVAQRRAGDAVAAVASHQRALDIRTKHGGDPGPLPTELTKDINTLSDLNQLQRLYEESRAQSPSSAKTYALLDRLAIVARAQRNWPLAADCLKKEIANHKGEHSIFVSTWYRRLIGVWFSCQNLPSARQWVEAAKKESALPPIELQSYQLRLFDAYIRGGQLTEAGTLCKALWGEPGIDVCKLEESQRRLIYALSKAGKSEEAKSALHQLFEERKKWLPHLRSCIEAEVLAEMASDLKETEFVPEVLTRGESLIPKNDSGFETNQFADIWEKLGDKKHAAALRAKVGNK